MLFRNYVAQEQYWAIQRGWKGLFWSKFTGRGRLNMLQEYSLLFGFHISLWSLIYFAGQIVLKVIPPSLRIVIVLRLLVFVSVIMQFILLFVLTWIRFFTFWILFPPTIGIKLSLQPDILPLFSQFFNQFFLNSSHFLRIFINLHFYIFLRIRSLIFTCVIIHMKVYLFFS